MAYFDVRIFKYQVLFTYDIKALVISSAFSISSQLPLQIDHLNKIH
jgi:hypothetical protein